MFNLYPTKVRTPMILSVKSQSKSQDTHDSFS